jgi:hypothetical protein
MTKKILLTVLVSVSCIPSVFSQWIYPGTYGNPAQYPSIVTAMKGTGPFEMTLGSAFGLQGSGYLSFNLTRNNPSVWNYADDGGNNGGAVMFAKMNGSLNFSFHQSTGAISGVLTDAQVKDNVKLSIEPTGDINMFRPYDPDARQIRAFSQNHGLFLFSNGSSSDGSGIEMWGNSSGGQGKICFISKENSDPQNVAFDFLTANSGTPPFTSHVRIRKDGKMVIGDVSLAVPNGYKLYVQGGILTERVKVALSNDPTNWSDFVFDEDYKLMPLSEVENYIEENNHLPEIPSTKEVLSEGLDLAKMDAKLLQKVEELTLYMIQLKKENEQLRKDFNKLHRK